MANGLLAGGDGTELSPYLVEDAHDLNAIRNNLTAHYKLIRNIDLDIAPYNEGEGWTPIGNSDVRFKGTVDGNGAIIKNLYINKTTGGNALFGYISYCTLKNIGLKNVKIKANDSSGSLVGNSMESNIMGCFSEGEISYDGDSRTYDTGGLIGKSDYTTISNCYSNVTLTGNLTRSGGLIGNAGYKSTIKNCYSTGAPRGLYGDSLDNEIVISSFWDVDTSGTTSSQGGVGLTTIDMQTSQTFVDVGWLNELDDSGDTVWILEDGKYPELRYNILKYQLIKLSDSIYTILDNELLDITENILNINNITFQEFETYGFTYLDDIDLLKSLNSFELITWVNSNLPIKLELSIPETKPYTLLDNPSIVTYTENDTIPVLSQAVLLETKVRFLVSKDKVNYYTYKDNKWIVVDKSQIMNNGMNSIELQSISNTIWSEWSNPDGIYNESFDILVGVYSENPGSPIIKNIVVNFEENKNPIIIDPVISHDSIHDEYATISGTLKDLEGDNLSYRVLIKQITSSDPEPVIPKLSSNIQDGYEVSASSIASSSYREWKAFNDSNVSSSDCWISKNGALPPYWLRVTLPEKMYVSKYSIESRNYTPSSSPKSWIFQGSNDAIKWDDIDTRLNVENWESAEYREYSVLSVNKYKYYRLYILDKYGSSGSYNYVAIGSFQIYDDGGYTIVDDWFDTNKPITEFSKSYNKPYFTVGENIIRLEVKDQRGEMSSWQTNLVMTNNPPLITYTYDSFGFYGVINDPESDGVSVQVSIDDNIIMPFTELLSTPRKFEYEWDTKHTPFNKKCKVKIELKDSFGGISTEEFTITGKYKSLLFMDEKGNYYTTDKGDILQYLNKGKIIAGQNSDPVKIKLLNETNSSLQNVSINPNKGNLPYNAAVKLSTEAIFNPKDSIQIPGIMNKGDVKDFYVSIYTAPGKGIIGGEFNISAEGTIIKK